jgi:hypothetical protein
MQYGDSWSNNLDDSLVTSRGSEYSMDTLDKGWVMSFTG